MKIDMFAHIIPDGFQDVMAKMNMRTHKFPPPILGNFEERIAVFEQYPELRNVLIPMDIFANQEKVETETAIELSKIHNDYMADIVTRYPMYILGGVASLPVMDIEASLREAERAVTQLGLKGLYLSCCAGNESIANKRMFPLYELAAKLDVPIWLHPGSNSSEYISKRPFGESMVSPLTTMWAMTDLACSGIFELCPDIKFITHHCGGYTPYFHYRLKIQYLDMGGYIDNISELRGKEIYEETDVDTGMADTYYNNLKKFYGDTAIYGISTAPLEAAHAFFGSDHLLFGTDFPLPSKDEMPAAIVSIEQMRISAEDKEKIFQGNARKLLHLE